MDDDHGSGLILRLPPRLIGAFAMWAPTNSAGPKVCAVAEDGTVWRWAWEDESETRRIWILEPGQRRSGGVFAERKKAEPEGGDEG